MGFAVRPDGRDRGGRTVPPTTWPQGVPRTSHVDYLLRFVIERSIAASDGIAGRLDALERTLVALTRAWRADTPLAPARELRVSEETLDQMLAWIEDGERPDQRELERLGVYASGAVTDGAVPDGWVRIRLSA
jgi:hypothetical protein